MKYSILFLAITFAFFSCRKEGTTVTKVINVSLSENQTYKVEVSHLGDADDIMQITSQPSHSSVCNLTPDASGNAELDYTPAVNYTGTDEIQVSNQEGQHQGGGGHQGKCGSGGGGHHHDDTTILIYKITISGGTTK